MQRSRCLRLYSGSEGNVRACCQLCVRLCIANFCGSRRKSGNLPTTTTTAALTLRLSTPLSLTLPLYQLR